MSTPPGFSAAAITNRLVIRSEFRQVFGRFSGTLVPDDGQAIQVVDIIGWVEQHRARW